MPRPVHSNAFFAARDAVLAFDEDRDRARLAGLFGHMTAPHRNLGALRVTLRAIAALDDADLDRLARWFSTWGQRVGTNAAGVRAAHRSARSSRSGRTKAMKRTQGRASEARRAIKAPARPGEAEAVGGLESTFRSARGTRSGYFADRPRMSYGGDMYSENNPANVGQVESAANTLIQFLKGYGTGGRVTPDAVTSRGGSMEELLAALEATIKEFRAKG